MIRGKCPAISRVVASGSPEARRKGLDDQVERSLGLAVYVHDPVPFLTLIFFLSWAAWLVFSVGTVTSCSVIGSSASALLCSRLD